MGRYGSRTSDETNSDSSVGWNDEVTAAVAYTINDGALFTPGEKQVLEKESSTVLCTSHR